MAANTQESVSTPSQWESVTDVESKFFEGDSHPACSAGCPWNHYKDLWDVYSSIGMQKRDELLKMVSDEERGRINYEKSRIDKYRSKAEGRRPFRNLADQRRVWQGQVAEDIPELRAEVSRDNNYSRKRRYLDNLRRLETYLKRGRTNPTTQDQEQYQDKIEDEDGTPAIDPEGDARHILDGVNAGVMYFEKAGSKFSGTPPEVWPNQKIPVFDLLEDEDNSELAKPCPPGQIRYFHFPSNNMEWIKKAISIYYSGRESNDAERILVREFWRGQMHGPSSVPQEAVYSGRGVKQCPPIHARHMRSKCSVILRGPSHQSSSTENGSHQEKPGRDIALFLPYLHWETSNRQAKMAAVVEEERYSFNNPSGNTGIIKSPTQHSMNTVLKDRLWKPQNRKRKPSCRKYLARYLLTVAYIADCERNDRLLRTYIYADSPMHVRRTLDQYYFLTQGSTSVRDRDQVVYRGTKPFDPPETTDKPGDGVVIKSEGQQRKRKLPHGVRRLVMVDQLWLWILDDNTIITAFPRRWGRNKPDSSGVHKTIRERLKSETDDITSVYHLALIIIDQCSQVFFLDQRPEVMDLFASAIGNVTNRTAIAYEVFWRYVAISNMLLSHHEVTHHKRLHINPEGLLHEEAQDIAEELGIMSRIFQEQRQVVKDFARHMGLFMNHNGRDSEQQQQQQGVKTEYQERMITYYDDVSESQHHPSQGGDNGLPPHDDSKRHAAVLLELIESRQAEIQDLEGSIVRTSQRIQGLLTLKQQQASIVEAKAALQRSIESVRQGRSIMAFTVVTIFFLPLGFFATFFGMNNIEINQSMWMSLNEQVTWMFGLSSIVIALTISIAFSMWVRALLRLVLYTPLVAFLEYTGIYDWWVSGVPINTERLRKRNSKFREKVLGHREARSQEKMAREDDTLNSTRMAKGTDNVALPSSPQAEEGGRDYYAMGGRLPFWRRKNHHGMDRDPESYPMSDI